MIRAVRENEQNGEASSNIVFSYGHCTIPRHLRDIVVTEYGIADLRAKSDSEVAKALINIADSRFQGDLLKQAKAAKKLRKTIKFPKIFWVIRPRTWLAAWGPWLKRMYYLLFHWVAILPNRNGCWPKR